MAYTTNPNLPKVRMEAVKLVKYEGWSMRKVARHTGYNQSTITRWCAHPYASWDIPIPTESSRPKTHPHALSRDVVSKIINERNGRNRCAEHVHVALKKQGVEVSLSSVKRTLDRCHLTKKRSPWKRPHDNTPRPVALYSGALLQCDTIHIIAPDGSKIYVYTVIDLYSRWAYAEVVEKIGAHPSIEFIKRAQNVSLFKFEMIQTDNGPEFSTWCTHGWLRLGINHRHGRVRKSNDQAHVERFNRTIQEECLDLTSHSLKSFKKEIPKFLNYYNTERTHMGINYLTPYEMMQRS
jgi:transposase InsO family protein